MTRKIAGIEVSQEVYDVFSIRRYKLSFGEVPLSTVELYATSEGIAKVDPAVSKECQEILEQIREQIREQSTGSPAKAEGFSEYLLRLRELYDKATGERKKLIEDHAKAAEEWDLKEAAAEAAGIDSGILRIKAERAEAEERYNQEMIAFREKVDFQIDAIRSALEGRLKEFYSLDGGRIDADTVKLLNSGIRLTEGELKAMFSQFAGNTTMLRLLSDYCAEKGINNQDAIILGKRALSEGSHELEVFDRAADRVRLATGAGSATAETVWSPEKGLFAKLLEDSVKELSEAIVKP